MAEAAQRVFLQYSAPEPVARDWDRLLLQVCVCTWHVAHKLGWRDLPDCTLHLAAAGRCLQPTTAASSTGSLVGHS